MRAFKVIRDPEAFQMLADDTRRKIVYLLRVKEMTVSQIASELGLTPQAIYHHIRKLKGAGMVEVAKEERVDHFIETYYAATAEIFHIESGEEGDRNTEITQSKEALDALTKLGFRLECSDELATRLVNIHKKMTEIGSKSEWDEKIAELDSVNFFGKQVVWDYVRNLSMKDEQFEEYLKLHREMREILQCCVKAPGAKKRKA